MYDSDMRALALNLAHGAGRKPDDVLSRARAYYGFLSGRDEAKAVAAANVANQVNPHALDIRNSASMMTSAEIQQAYAAQRAANALNPYAGMTALETQEAMLGARGE